MPDVLENINLCSLDGQALHGLDGEQLQPKKYNVAVVVSASILQEVLPFFKGPDDSLFKLLE
ncbi:hypothetical protein C0993_006644 [Termitomyces sp. T159_Od127]|nr:hypothetical protein C0993_006644 [Termitomyces sp. T159_Od127]